MSDFRTLEVRMLGGFSVSYGGKEIVIDRNAVSKTTQLFQVVLLHASEGISKAGLMDALYSRDEVENKNASLNNTIFRLRRQLRAAGLGESTYLNIQGGMCTWDPALPVWVDVCEFEKLAARRLQESGETRIKTCREAVRLYSGEFLPAMIGEDWVTVENVRCRDLYFDCMRELCGGLMELEHYEEVCQLAKSAAALYPFEDWQLWEIDSLMAMNRYQEALNVYERTSRLAFDELGLSPSPEMLKRFRAMAEHVSQTAEVTADIKARLMERERTEGAYYCAFPSFVDIYHVFSRMMERNGLSVYIMLCTLTHDGRKAVNEEHRDASGLLAKSICHSLRRGDFYTRYSYTQYLIMFAEISQENCKIVSDRILRNFKQKAGKDYGVDFSVTSIADFSSVDSPEKHFARSGENWK